MKCCDTCGKDNEYLYDLLETHQTREIKHVCSGCKDILDNHKMKLQTATAHILLDWFKAFATNLRKQNSVKRGFGND